MRSSVIAWLLCFFCCAVSWATIVPAVSFETLVAQSDQIVSGHVGKSWTSWDSTHKFIWTRYSIAVDRTVKGAAERTVTVSEPGGELDGIGMSVDGAVVYPAGEHVLLFLKRYPGGDKRTVGWAQGKFTIDAKGRVHSLVNINGFTTGQLTEEQIRARILTTIQKGKA